MNKTVGGLIIVIVVLVAVVAFLVGRMSGSESVTTEVAQKSGAATQATKSELSNNIPEAEIIEGLKIPAEVASPEIPWGSAKISARCDVTINGVQIMSEACSGRTPGIRGKENTIFLTSISDGCSVQLERTGARVQGTAFAYKNVCETDEFSDEPQDWALGSFVENGNCLESAAARICFNP